MTGNRRGEGEACSTGSTSTGVGAPGARPACWPARICTICPRPSPFARCTSTAADPGGAADGTVTQDTFCYYVSVACNHCGNPACVRVCPTGAMHKGRARARVGGRGRCIGCGYCALSCPYRAPKVDRDAGRSVKCDGCTRRVAEGGAPVCVEACPLRALDFGPIDELREKYGAVADVPPLPDATRHLPEPGAHATGPRTGRPRSRAR